MHPEMAAPHLSAPQSFRPTGDRDGLRPYKLGLAVIGVFTLVLAVFVLFQAGAAKQDAATEKAASRIAGKLDGYIADRQRIPASLKEAGITETAPAITYKKLSAESYRFCVTYRAASSGYSGDLLDEAISRGMYPSGTGGAYANDSAGSDGYLYISPTHKKGANCQKITPYITAYDDNLQDPGMAATDPKTAAAAAGKENKGCYIGGYATHYSGQISSITALNGESLTAGGDQELVLKVTPHGSLPAGEQTITVASGAVSVFDRTCNALPHASLAVGDQVAIFAGNESEYMPDLVVDFSSQ